MPIPEHAFESVRSLNIDDHQTFFSYERWEANFPADTFLGEQIAAIKQGLGDGVTRSDVVSFYANQDIDPETKFIAAMLWGHGATLGGKSDMRGPWKLGQMFSNPKEATDAIRSVSLSRPEDMIRSYKRLDKTLKRCGPNFFTKHFYFYGKADGLKPYPLIFDDRVARGLIKTTARDPSWIGMVQISALRKPKPYLGYLQYVQKESKRIGCGLDQVEYYLFRL